MTLSSDLRRIADEVLVIGALDPDELEAARATLRQAADALDRLYGLSRLLKRNAIIRDENGFKGAWVAIPADWFQWLREGLEPPAPPPSPERTRE